MWNIIKIRRERYGFLKLGTAVQSIAEDRGLMLYLTICSPIERNMIE